MVIGLFYTCDLIFFHIWLCNENLTTAQYIGILKSNVFLLKFILIL